VGFRKCCTSNAVDATADGDTLWALGRAVQPMQWMGPLMMIHCGTAMNRMGMLGKSVRKMKVLTVKMETDTE
jgi:hypothetical protein